MCNLYSLTKGQAAIVALVRAMRDFAGNLPPMPGVFPDFLAPIARDAPDGVRELAMARWGMPGPPAFGAPITNRGIGGLSPLRGVTRQRSAARPRPRQTIHATPGNSPNPERKPGRLWLGGRDSYKRSFMKITKSRK
jgi:putative SOS response-associated peptidase YedK